MLNLFYREKSYLGIDFGENEIKIVELKKGKERPILNTYGVLKDGVGILKKTEIPSSEIAKKLKDLLKRAKITAKTAISSLPSFSVFNAIISIPEIPEKELKTTIYWEAKKYIPGPIEDVVLDWRILKKEETSFLKFSEKNTIEVLLTAAPKKIVNKHIEILKLVNLFPYSLETEAFATIRSLINGEKERIMTIDLGAKTIDICIVENMIPLISQTVKMGGDNITEVISKTLNIDKEKAEQFKKDFSLGFSEEKKLPEILKPVIDDILEGIKHSLNLYYSQGGEKIEKIILTGGGSRLIGLVKYLKEKLQIEKIFLGNPWAQIAYAKELEPLLFKIGPSFAVACGLALKEINY